MSSELSIKKYFGVSTIKVFDAWTKPELLSQWMGPGSVTCIKVEIDLKIGGRYEIHMQTEGGIKIACGSYQTIDPNKTLSFTWRWQDSDMPESLVTLTFTEIEGGTEMQLLHTLLPSEESAEHHTAGWNGSILKLESFLKT